jgi:hypothetical protein
VTKAERLRVIEHQIQRLRRRLQALRRTSERFSWIRIATFAAAAVATGLAFRFAGVWPAVATGLAGLIVFGVAVYYHRQVNASIHRYQLWLEIKSAHVARARLEWERIPSTFSFRPQPEHPFEQDLNLVGQRSVHQLLDTAVSFEGSRRLKEWLTETAPDPDGAAQHQQLVRELVPLAHFRDKLALNATVAAGTSKTWEARQLLDWLQDHAPAASLRPWLLFFAAFAGLNIALFVANRLGLLPQWWQLTLVLYLGLLLAKSGTTRAVSDEAVALQGSLQQLRAVFGQLEAYSWQNRPRLQALCAPFADPTQRPSRHLSRITTVVAATGLRANPIMWFLLNSVGPWDFFYAYRLDQLKAELAEKAPAWMEVWFELEAAASLANLAYLNPSFAFPRLYGQPLVGDGAAFRASDLGHPLLPDEERVCNDFEIPALGQVALITGSNMAGKSVFLRTVGVNLALAYAGGPVIARHLETRVFRLFTSITVTDSVIDGISYFYAEVGRLKRLLAALETDHPLPLLYCIDEIFRGTNNRERLIGSRAYVQALAGPQKRGTGLIATHDLELTTLADDEPFVKNYHFRDHVVDSV